MEDVLCGVSAFRYHRIPPIARMAYPALPNAKVDRHRRQLLANPLACDALGFPVHTLVSSRAERTGVSNIKQHLFSGELPPGSIIEDYDLEVRVTSPLMTLFTLARAVSEAHLLMAMYELCGSFTLFRPSSEIEQYLEQERRFMSLGADEGWLRVRDTSGRPTDLWKRPPLIEVHEIQKFAGQIEHLRGGKRFAGIAAKVMGVTASPFEVQLSILLSLSRTEGGEGLGGFTTNHEIRLSRDAQRIAGKSHVYADLYYEGSENLRPFVIECQGGLAHSGDAAAMSDADRMAALQGMGIDVLPLTYKQIANRENFGRIARHIAAKLGKSYREKSARLRDKEVALRSELFIDWLTLGS